MQTEIDLNESEIDLNECERFLKTNLHEISDLNEVPLNVNCLFKTAVIELP